MGECVLVVDDDREIVKAIGILLEGEGYKVLKAYDGMQALDILATNPVRLVLIDVMMPKLDGLSALMRIREKQNIPIIVLSAKGEDSDKVLGLSMGADDYVAKPYNPQELAARVKSHLRRYTSSHQELERDMDFAERFARGDRSRTDGGSGLGLSIAQSFTEACGGEFRWETDADLFIVKVSFQTFFANRA